MLTKEEKKETDRLFRLRHIEKILIKDRLRWKIKRSHQEKIKRFRDKKCRLCDIKLVSKYGARYTRVHCFGCAQDKKMVKRIQKRLYRAKWSPEQLEKHKQYMRDWHLKNKVVLSKTEFPKILIEKKDSELCPTRQEEKIKESAVSPLKKPGVRAFSLQN